MMANDQDSERFQSVLNVSRETIERLKIYETLLRKWNPAINLVGRNTINEIWTRHFLDSAQIWALRPASAKTWLDLGSGAGFPGLVIALLAADEVPDLQVTLVESDARKGAFLQNASREMGISVELFTERVENLEPQQADVISARALAPLSKLLGFAERHGTENTICLFSKGRSYESELTEVRKCWTFETQILPSMTDSDGKILKIGEFLRV